MRNIFIFFGIFITGLYNGCDLAKMPEPFDSSNYVTNEVFIPYIKNFESYYGKPANYVPIVLVEMESPYLGKCYTYTRGPNVFPIQIEISSEFWSRTSEDAKNALIFHELGHCVLNLDHYGSIMPDDCPSSLMNHYLPDHTCISRHWDRYMFDMFGVQ